MSTDETEQSNSHSRKVVGWSSLIGGLVILVADSSLWATGQIGLGDAIATDLSTILFLVAANRFAAQGKFGANFGEKGFLRRHWIQVTLFVLFMVVVPILSSLGTTNHEYTRSIAIINGVFIGASFLLWAIDRPPKVCPRCSSLLLVVEIDEAEGRQVGEEDDDAYVEVPTLIANQKKASGDQDL